MVTATVSRPAPALVSLSLADGAAGKAETLTCTPEHPLYVSGKGWVEAGDLGVGTSIVTRAGPPVVVKSVSWRRDETGSRPFTVYNLAVEGDHTYFAGDLEGGAWAHNVWAGKNHFFPRALGSPIPLGRKVLTHLSSADHTAFHDQLNAYLAAIEKGGINMYPRKGNPGELVRKTFSPQERIDAVRAFMKNFRGGQYINEFEREIQAAGKYGGIK